MDRLLLAAIVTLALALRLWNLDQNGWGAGYYSAAVRSMAQSWPNFLYCAFDPLGFISVDKPPVALWAQVASVKLLGYMPFALLLPQVLEGTACVWLVHRIVKRRFGSGAALLAALFLALSPILVAVNRTNNIDSCLVLVLLLASAALLEAAASGKRAWLMLSLGLVGVAFNTKMLAGFIVLPAFFLLYLICAPIDLRRRFIDLTLGGLLLLAISVSWMLVFDLTPPQVRPYAGSSKTNSMVELMIGHNALSRFTRIGKAPPPGAGNAPQAATATDESTEPRPGAVTQRLFVRAPTGPARLFRGQLAAQTQWLLPLAAMGLVLGAMRLGWRRPHGVEQQLLLFWTLWIATYTVVYSATGGIMHYYYLATLAPAIAALAGIGAVELWRLYARGGRLRFLLPATLAATALWQVHVHLSALDWAFDVTRLRAGDWRAWLHLELLAGTVIAASALLYLARGGPIHRASALGAAAVGLASLMLVPTAWALSSALTAGHGILPSADLYRLDPAVMESDSSRVRGTPGQMQDTSHLVDFLRANRSGERYLLATTTTRYAAPLIIATGEPVMAMGGYHGLDAAMTPEKLGKLAASGELRFVMLGDAPTVSRRMGADEALEPISQWVRDHGRRIDGRRWRSPGFPRDVAIYDLRPGESLR